MFIYKLTPFSFNKSLRYQVSIKNLRVRYLALPSHPSYASAQRESAKDESNEKHTMPHKFRIPKAHRSWTQIKKIFIKKKTEIEHVKFFYKKSMF